MNNIVDCNPLNINDLPNEITIYYIFAKLPQKDILSFGQTCKRFNEISRKDCLWKMFFNRFKDIVGYTDPFIIKIKKQRVSSKRSICIKIILMNQLIITKN